ncbi:MAG: hypothetical protein AB1Z98_37050 [Nannocystaceae bacterium]
MMVQLSPELFESPSNDLLLLVMFEHGWQGEHRIDTETAHPAVAAWLERQERDVREQCTLALEAAAHAEALEPAALCIVVVEDEQSNWSCSPPRLSPQDARALLRKPFEILVEDSISDRAFLRKMMTPAERHLVDALERQDRLAYVHAGGSRLRSMLERRSESSAASFQS